MPTLIPGDPDNASEADDEPYTDAEETRQGTEEKDDAGEGRTAKKPTLAEPRLQDHKHDHLHELVMEAVPSTRLSTSPNPPRISFQERSVSADDSDNIKGEPLPEGLNTMHSLDTTMRDVQDEGDDMDETSITSDKDSEDGDKEQEDPAAESDVEQQHESTSTSTETTTESPSESESESSDEDQEDSSEGSDASDDASEPTQSNACIFCRQAEDKHDSGELQVYLKCVNCANAAHDECARQNNAIVEDQDSSIWQCPDCPAVKSQSESPKDVLARARSTAPRLVRDLLPVSRGVQKPNSHSIFAQPLISDGEDGGRALRKRKSPTQEPPMSKKRRKRAAAAAAAADAMTANNTTESSTLGSDQGVAHSTRRASQKLMPTTRILQHRPFNKPPPHKFILAFRLEQDQIEAILNRPPRPRKRRDRRRAPKIPPPPVFQPPVPKFPALPTNHLIFPSMFTERENDSNAKPYGGILSEQEADTSRSLPQLRDREIFEIARKEAEEERRRTSAAAEAEINGDAVAAAAKPNRIVSGPPSKIKCIQFGRHVIDTFYAAPYPEEYSHESRLFICEFCLKYLPSEFVAYRHKLKCPAMHPPGDEIYRDGSISIWEVDGRKKTEYCQCLCLMAKMFLGSKTLYYDVEPFLFYILTEYDELGYHFVGYFSKEKRPASQNNVSCILVMPIHQRKGYATFLIDFSYLLTRIEGKDGSPEKPLSDMGLTAYRSYWDLTISRHLLDMELKPFSTKALMLKTGMTADDVIHSLERLYALVKDPVTKTYAVRYNKKLYQTIVNDFDSKKHRMLNPVKLVWTPYIMGRSDQAHLDGQPIQAIAPREEDLDLDDITEPANAEIMLDSDAVSPRSKSRSSRPPSRHQSVQPKNPVKDDMDLVNSLGHVAPGPPSTEALTAATIGTNELAEQPQIQVNGIVNPDAESVHETSIDADSSLSGYALAYRTQNIPPSRFQIDPPIPPSMLRSRSTKKRAHGSAFGSRTAANGPNKPGVVPLATRSSPRNASSVNGSVNGNGRRSRNMSPDKLDTPIRRSSRKSRLANMEVATSLDGLMDEDDEDASTPGNHTTEEEEEVGDEIEVKDDSSSSEESEEALDPDEADESVDEDEPDDNSQEDSTDDAEQDAEGDSGEEEDDDNGQDESLAKPKVKVPSNNDDNVDDEDEDEEEEESSSEPASPPEPEYDSGDEDATGSSEDEEDEDEDD